MATLHRVVTQAEAYARDKTDSSPLQVIRALLNLSAAELARLADIDRATVRRLERGEHRPQTRTALKIAAVLNCPAELLFPLNDETQPGRAASRTTSGRGEPTGHES